MPYKPTGRPNGRPRKDVAPEAEERKPFRRPMRAVADRPARRFVSASAPAPYELPADTSMPAFGQRRVEKHLGPCLRPNPLKA